MSTDKQKQSQQKERSKFRHFRFPNVRSIFRFSEDDPSPVVAVGRSVQVSVKDGVSNSGGSAHRLTFSLGADDGVTNLFSLQFTSKKQIELFLHGLDDVKESLLKLAKDMPELANNRPGANKGKTVEVNEALVKKLQTGMNKTN